MHWTNARWKHLVSTAFKWRLDKLSHVKRWRFYGLIPISSWPHGTISSPVRSHKVGSFSPYEHTCNDDADDSDDDPDDDDASNDTDCYHDCFCTSV